MIYMLRTTINYDRLIAVLTDADIFYILAQCTLSLFKIMPFIILIICFLVLDANNNKEAQNDIKDIERNIIDIMFL